MRTAIDTNIVSAVWGGEPPASRLADFLDEASGQGGLVISPIVYMELRGYPSVSADFVNGFIETMQIAVDWDLDEKVWQLAAERFEQYVRRKREQGSGEPKRFPADFLVAAHAAVRADRLVTLDQKRYRTDFPELNVVEP